MIPQQRYTTVLRYRLVHKESDAEDAPRAASNNSADGGHDRDELLQPANLVTSSGPGEEEQGTEGEAEVPQPFDYFETEEVPEDQVSSQKVYHNSHR